VVAFYALVGLRFALRSRLIFGAMVPTKKSSSQYFFGGPYFLDRDDFNTHWRRFLALAAANLLRKINLVDRTAFLARQFSKELTHGLRFLYFGRTVELATLVPTPPFPATKLTLGESVSRRSLVSADLTLI
jgi:hypothetical protein